MWQYAASHIQPLYYSSLHDRSKYHKTSFEPNCFTQDPASNWMKNNVWLKLGLFLDFWWYLRWCHCYSFGITPTLEKVHHDGTMYTKVDDCQFVCVPQEDYCRILHEVKHSVVFCLLFHVSCGKKDRPCSVEWTYWRKCWFDYMEKTITFALYWHVDVKVGLLIKLHRIIIARSITAAVVIVQW